MTEEKKPRGFAAMSEEQRRELQARGGRSVPPSKRPFAADRELASRAGRDGGKKSHGGGRKSRDPV